jgi:Holliday junction DNA helicase RuvB
MSKEGLSMRLNPDLPPAVMRRRVVRGIALELEALKLLIQASHGLPRIGLALLKEALETTEHFGTEKVRLAEAQEALRAMDLDARGFDRVQRRILEILQEHVGPMGLDYLATHVGKPAETIREIYEPEFVRHGWVRRTPRGRQFVRQVAARQCA